ncbi:hypothetical protein K6U06_20220 [Acidiferrimicrobium sp. IK]|uniref:hypothetical protein n=1 Tax=Acidiferrimicrobium sp. IK TaxID=2871700 RepID=UPI0021CB0865|nr:hypothetical protein [Acidiferrimicrobium sp. IK]MCU4186701.1 hypothetical protein [Acidiferrimicrobium sp. IK]
MNSDAIFWLQIGVSVGVVSLITLWYVWPPLTKLSLQAALVPLLFVQVFRYVGMTLLVKGMIDPRLSHNLLRDGAYGDLLAGALALAAIFALRYNWSFAIPLAWVANTWGSLDVVNVLRGVVSSNVPSYHLASIWYIYTFYAPLVVVSAVMIFVVLFKSRSWNKAPVPV